MIKDFSYDGERLSEYGLIIASIDNSSASDVLEWGSQLDFNTVQNKNNGRNYITSSTYSEVYSVTFQVIKFSCDSDCSEHISDTEYRQLVKWLNQKAYKDFSPISDNEEFSGYHFWGSFNVKPIIVNADIIGLELTFTTDTPYAFGDIVRIEKETTEFDVYCISDELEYQPMKTTITLLQDGNLNITNKTLGETTSIKNCKKNEIITIDSENLIITTSADHTYLYNDFNYVYPKLLNEYRNNKNTFTVSLPCKIIFEYRPARKIGVIL